MSQETQIFVKFLLIVVYHVYLHSSVIQVILLMTRLVCHEADNSIPNDVLKVHIKQSKLTR